MDHIVDVIDSAVTPALVAAARSKRRGTIEELYIISKYPRGSSLFLLPQDFTAITTTTITTINVHAVLALALAVAAAAAGCVLIQLVVGETATATTTTTITTAATATATATITVPAAQTCIPLEQA